MDKYTIAPPAGSTNNSVGASDRPWKEGHFDSVKLNGGDLGEYLAESTGYGIVSGCEPSISGLTVTVAAGVVHLANGTRKEIASTNITLDSADPTNPRIDLVYITSAGEVAKVTGTAASPSAPSVPTGGISVCTVTVAAGATTGILNHKMMMAKIASNKVKFLFPKTIQKEQQGDCQIIVTKNKVMMIDANDSNSQVSNYILDFLVKNGVKKIDYFLLTHYHGDHYGGIPNFLAQSKVDFSETEWLIPSNVFNTSLKNTVKGYLSNRNYRELTDDETLKLADDVYVDLMCCNSDVVSAADRNDENKICVYALVRHGKVNVLYTGDGYQPELEFVRTTYDIPHINILKIPHHGVNSDVNAEKDILFFKEKTPDYAVYNHGWDHWNSDISSSNPFGTNIRYFSQYPQMVGTKTYHLTSGDAVFCSDSTNIQLEQPLNLYPVNSKVNPPTIKFYVDSSVTEKGNGTEEKPYRSIDEMIAELPIGSENSVVDIYVADGTYASLFVVGYHGKIRFNGNFTVKRVLIKNCSDIFLSGTITVNQIGVAQSNVFIAACTTIVTSDSFIWDWYSNPLLKPNLGQSENIVPINIYMSKLHIYQLEITVDSAFTESKTNIIEAGESLIALRNWYIHAVGNASNCVMALNRSALFVTEIKRIGAFNIPVITPAHGTAISINGISNVDVNFNGRLLNSSRGQCVSVPGAHIGNSSSRPNGKLITEDFYYYDTTLGHMLIWTGSKWHDCTTNADL